MAITIRTTHLTATLYIAGAVWCAATAYVLSSDVLLRREQCERLIHMSAPTGQEWLRMDSFNKRFAVCAVSKLPFRGYMISSPIFPDPFLSGALLAVPLIGFIGFFGFRKFKTKPLPWRRIWN